MRFLTVEHQLYALVAVLGTLATVLVLGWLVRRPGWARIAGDWHGVVPPFVNITGTLFALTLAFIANDTWAARDRALDSVFREAEALRSLLTLAQALPDGPAQDLAARTRDYGRAAADEWPALRRAEADLAASRAADALLIAAASPDMQNALPTPVGQAVLERVSALRADRDMRVALTQTHLNPLKWMAMAWLGFLTLASVAAVHLENRNALWLAVLLFALAAAPAAAIVLMQGNPFQHPAAVTPDPIIAAVTG
ncbi:MAG: DUF4239 domain-containing protein [Paracoccus sp. (in: a-proteobacteria)]|uniref:bestrophin-like domain n=1 Tax=Paracoccus sp. TaxID=267 RepID=UPI0026E0224D|nr:DUF4239 domain-containing protein [Paracoccus sp. (in: a-proteobacteria)]MDO5613659.1 DUF4239 domain-containing protein [Paracoccus sp. (in: a-proteobacteria)]